MSKDVFKKYYIEEKDEEGKVKPAEKVEVKVTDEEIYENLVNNTYKETELFKKCLEVLENIDFERKVETE